ncbi:MAG: hypothetical protein SPH89_09060, partial [Candidatus Limisoma sp.]|nr:hypothetical protein [Candidatus Limisoma sp.]
RLFELQKSFAIFLTIFFSFPAIFLIFLGILAFPDSTRSEIGHHNTLHALSARLETITSHGKQATTQT